MAALRYYYTDSITNFLSRNNNEIVGELTLASQHDVNDETTKSWVEEIETMREFLGQYKGVISKYIIDFFSQSCFDTSAIHFVTHLS